MFILTEQIVTDRLVLRPFTAEDLDDLYAIQSRPEVVPYLYWDVRTRDEVGTVLQERLRMDRLTAEGDTLLLAVQRRDTARVIGDVNLYWASAQHRQGEIGFVFHPDQQGKGYAREAASAVLDLAFDGLGLHRVYGRVDSRNVASASLLRRLGMRQEAHLVHNEFFKGEWTDELLFAVLADEWAVRRRSSGRPPG
jgi:RimJ/RimL family protein N-acetyltransferase